MRCIAMATAPSSSASGESIHSTCLDIRAKAAGVQHNGRVGVIAFTSVGRITNDYRPNRPSHSTNRAVTSPISCDFAIARASDAQTRAYVLVVRWIGGGGAHAPPRDG